MIELARGVLVTNGASALRLTERVARDPQWRVAGWRGENVALERHGGNVGMTSFVPDYLLTSWRVIPFEWSPLIGGMEERYTWTPDYSRLQRELRRSE